MIKHICENSKPFPEPNSPAFKRNLCKLKSINLNSSFQMAQFQLYFSLLVFQLSLTLNAIFCETIRSCSAMDMQSLLIINHIHDITETIYQLFSTQIIIFEQTTTTESIHLSDVLLVKHSHVRELPLIRLVFGYSMN